MSFVHVDHLDSIIHEDAMLMVCAWRRSLRTLPTIGILRYSVGPRIAYRWYSVLGNHNGQKIYKNIPVGNSGNVQLEIIAPGCPGTNNNVLVILPSKGLPRISQNTSEKPPVSSILSALIPTTTIITINYRLSPPKFLCPIPIHDVFTAFDYITHSDSPHNANSAPKIALLGSRIGGALATSLALTHPDSTHAVAVSEPLVDWVGLDDLISSKKPRARMRGDDAETQAALRSLLSLRSKLFSSPSGYFDQFSSPVLFLRAPGRDTPLSHDESCCHFQDEHDIDLNGDTFGPYDDDVHSQSPSPSNSPSPPAPLPSSTAPPSPNQSTTQHEPTGKRRKVLRPFPPSFTLPLFRVFTKDPTSLSTATSTSSQATEIGLSRILHAQGTELVDLLRRACFIGQQPDTAESRVGLEVLTPQDEEREKKGGRGRGDFAGLEQAAMWLQEKLHEK